MKANRRFSLIYGIFLLAFTLFTVLETFVIPQTYQVVAEAATETEVVEQAEYEVEDEEETAETTEETASETAQITDTTSSILESTGGILAINGDYYSARRGYVIRNGVLYSESSAGSDQEDLVIWADGTMEVIKEGDVTAKATKHPTMKAA